MKIGRWEGNEIIYTIDVNGNSVNLIENFDFTMDILGANMVVSGMVVSEAAVPDMTVLISAGIAKDFTVGTFLIGNALVGTVTASDPILDRRDNVEIRRIIEDITLETRQFKDPVTEGITESEINTEAEYKTEVQINAGTPGASPSAPATTAGWIKIAEISVLAASLTVVDAVIYNVDAEKAGVANTNWTSDISLTHLNGTISEMKTFMVDHKEDDATSINTVHGIRQGAGNAFDADLLDGLHKTEILATTTVYEITTSSDEIHALPDATIAENQQIIKRRGSGSGIVTFTTESSQTIDDEAASLLELAGDSSIILIPKGGNWESVKTGAGADQKDGFLGETITANDLVYYSTNGKLLTGDKGELSKSILAGFLITSGVLDDLRYVQASGIMDGFTGLVEGTQYYLGDAGAIVVKGAINYEDYIVSVGVAVSTTEMDVSIRLPEPTRSQDDGLKIGDFKFAALSEDRTAEGLIQWAFDNAISQANYPILWAKIGHKYNAQHVAAGDTDLSASGTLFYPTPVPGAYDRVGIPDIDFTDSDVGTDIIDNTFLTDTNFRDGSLMMLHLVSGTLPTGLTDETEYYIKTKATAGQISLHTSESGAIDNTDRVTFSGGSGTFRLTQEGIVLDDAMKGHKLTRATSTDGSHPNVTGGDGVIGTGSYGIRGITGAAVDEITLNDIITDGVNGDVNPTNETRPKTNYSFGYIKAEHVTSAGEPISALRDSQDWVEFTGDWTNHEFIITPSGAIGYTDIDDVYNLQIEIWLADNDTPTNPVKMVTMQRMFDQATPSAVDVVAGLAIMPNNTTSFKLQTGTLGIQYMKDDGTYGSLSSSSTGAYKVIVTKPNLINTVFDVSNMPKTYDLTSADVEVSLPARSGVLQTRDIFWTNGGTYKLTIREHADDGGALLDYEGEGDGRISLTASSAAWEVKIYEDSGSNANGEWEKYISGKLICRFSDTTTYITSAVRSNIFSSSGITFTFAKSFISAPIVHNSVRFIVNRPWPGMVLTITTTGCAMYILGETVTTSGQLDYTATGRWKA